MRSLRSPLSRARGLGSAKAGTEHWWGLKLTSLALVPLTLWFVASVIAHAGASHAEVVAWLSRPVNAVLMILTLGVTFHHMAQGTRSIIEDYVHHEMAKTGTIVSVNGLCWIMAVATIFSVLRIAFGG